VVHVGCGDGSLTKMLASKGLRVWGVDADVSAATQRGLSCVPFQGTPLAEGSLAAAAAATASAAAGSSGVDAVVVYTSSGSSTSALVADSSALTPSALAEMGRLLQRGGRLCVEVPLAGAAAAAAGGGGEQERLRGALGQARYGTIACCQVLPGWAGQQPRVRLVAEWSGH
jgi:3-hydroxyisobutyrate dehydrogenase-like beta-hydroxyacid dehydrogenase